MEPENLFDDPEATFRLTKEPLLPTVNCLIQLNDKAQEGWRSCVMIVEEVRTWGVLAYMKLPMQGDTYLRVPTEHFDVVGHALWVHPETVVDQVLQDGENSECGKESSGCL